MINRFLKEPLLHFVLAGALVFATYAYLHRGPGEDSRVVRITAAEVGWLKDTWVRQWQREPSEAELRGLVADYLRESLLAREAGELGLDQNDMIVRRRLAQKMEFLIRDTASLAEPGETALRALYDADRERFHTGTLVTFEQIYFKTEADARRNYAALVAGGVIGPGEPTLLERDHVNADSLALSAIFGPEFAAGVLALEPGAWRGPVESGYGFHLVHVRGREAARPRPFDEVRSQLVETWHREEQARADDKFFAALLDKYDVVVDESVRPLLGSLDEVAR